MAREVDIPSLELRDPLAELLGARAPGATFRYTYDDAVKLSGHSCPTVAGAWLMTVAALGALYRDPELPVRGGIQVTVGGAPGDGTSGPIAQVIALVTGAAPETGFGGLMGQHKRKDLLRFEPTLAGRVRFRRVDTGREVEVAYDPRPVPASPELGPLLAKTLAGRASREEARRFAELWQGRVADLLGGDPARVLEVRKIA